jgi:hypothetical protein
MCSPTSPLVARNLPFPLDVRLDALAFLDLVPGGFPLALVRSRPLLARVVVVGSFRFLLC